MKTYFLSLLFEGLSFMAISQPRPVKILFDVTSKDTLTHQAVLRHVQGMSSSYPQSSFEVVIYGGAITMVLNDQSTVAKPIEAAKANKNVTFAVCAETMKRLNVDKSQLLPGVIIVPDAIMEIVTKQGDGWGYIKESHH
jgi:hypothetical protein